MTRPHAQTEHYHVHYTSIQDASLVVMIKSLGEICAIRCTSMKQYYEMGAAQRCREDRSFLTDEMIGKGVNLLRPNKRLSTTTLVNADQLTPVTGG